MTLDQAIKLVRDCSTKMSALYGKPVFNEWVIAQFLGNNCTPVYYEGPRPNDFKLHFANDVKGLESRLLSHSYSPGDFEFAPHASGTQYEAFMVVGKGLYLLCNNTVDDMQVISKDPKWLAAQVPFHELTDKFRGNQLVLASQPSKPA